MITTLAIKDFAIISHLELHWGVGMTVLTGETGAGKSIVINAIKLLLGARASTDIIRTGAEEAIVEAVISLDGLHGPSVTGKLQEMGVDCSDGEFIVRRIIPRNGRGRIYIGGTLQSASILRELMRSIIDISGQHEHVSLLDTSKHLDIVDRFAGLETEVTVFSERYQAYRARLREREALAAELDERAKKLDFLNYQIDELRAAGIKIGEADEVAEMLKRLSNAEALLGIIQEAQSVLYDGDNAMISELGAQLTAIRRASLGDVRFANVCESLASAMSNLEEAVSDLRRVDVEEASGSKLEALESRLSVIDRLERKYRTRADEIPALKAKLEAERAELVLSDARIAELDKDISQDKVLLSTLATKLSDKREVAAKDLAQKATERLQLLAMASAEICISHEIHSEFEALRSTGCDSLEFLLAPNLGETPKSLAKIASGGELSRVLLAIKRVLVDKDEVACYIFDEVDTGIGGVTATNVAVMLKELSCRHQVLCITHLASIASYADAHYQVSKSIVSERTLTQIVELDEAARVAEIARMMGATALTSKTMEHAAEMLARAHAQADVSS